MRKPLLVLLGLAVAAAGCQGSIAPHIKSRVRLGKKTNSAVALVVNEDLKKRKLNGINIGEGWINLLDARLAQHFNHSRIINESDLEESAYYDLWVFPRFYEHGEEFQLQLVGKTSPYGRPVISTDVMGCALHKKLDIGETAFATLGTYGLYIPFIPFAMAAANKETVANIEAALAESTDKLVGRFQAEMQRKGFMLENFGERRAGGSTRIELRTDELADTVSGFRAGQERYNRKRKWSFAK
ncbi:MAG: hypothetical protein ACE5G9_08895 [Nitrospinales bacterium]